MRTRPVDPFDGVISFAVFLASGSITAFVLGMAAHIGWGMVR